MPRRSKPYLANGWRERPCRTWSSICQDQIPARGNSVSIYVILSSSGYPGHCMAVRFAFDEVVPGENQPSTSKRYDSFLEMFDCGPARRGIAAHCAPDSRNQSPKQAARNCFGDRFLLVLLVTVVDARSQTSIANQYLWVRKPGDSRIVEVSGP